MREIGHLPRRVVGRLNIERRLRRDLIACGRALQHRTHSAADSLWLQGMYDVLSWLLRLDRGPAGEKNISQPGNCFSPTSQPADSPHVRAGGRTFRTP
jgi:hypothetical protein